MHSDYAVSYLDPRSLEYLLSPSMHIEGICGTMEESQTLETPFFFKRDASKPAQILPWKDKYLYYPSEKTNLSSALERDTISSFQGSLTYKHS